jgi:hypothetical protein
MARTTCGACGIGFVVPVKGQNYRTCTHCGASARTRPVKLAPRHLDATEQVWWNVLERRKASRAPRGRLYLDKATGATVWDPNAD